VGGGREGIRTVVCVCVCDYSSLGSLRKKKLNHANLIIFHEFFIINLH
jgi:hypothetical protein